MFSDKFRLVKISLLLGILGALVVYVEVQGPKVYPGFREFQKNPNSFVNKEVEFGGKIKKIDSENFLVERIVDEEKTILKIKGELKTAKLEDNINGVALYNKEGNLILKRYVISNSRPIKIAISLIAFLWVIFLLFRNFTFNFRQFVFKERGKLNLNPN